MLSGENPEHSQRSLIFAFIERSSQLTLALLNIYHNFDITLYCHESLFGKTTYPYRESFTSRFRNRNRTISISLYNELLRGYLNGADPGPLRRYRPTTPEHLPDGYFSHPESEHRRSPTQFDYPNRYNTNERNAVAYQREEHLNRTFQRRRRHRYLQTITELDTPLHDQPEEEEVVSDIPDRHRSIVLAENPSTFNDDVDPRATNHFIPSLRDIYLRTFFDYEDEYESPDSTVDSDSDTLSIHTLDREEVDIDLDFNTEFDEQ